MVLEKNVSSSVLNPGESQLCVTISEESNCYCNVDDVEKPQSVKSDEVSEVDKSEEKKTASRIILEDSNNLEPPYKAWIEKVGAVSPIRLDSPGDYLDREMFPILLPAMENMLDEARSLDVLRIQKCRFNGLDYLAENLWNKNPKWPSREKWLNVYDIPQFKLCLKLRPRPIFPKSWLWSADEAASRIQCYVRGWLVRKRDDVQELRQFWKVIRDDKKGQESSETSQGSREMDICERYKLLAKKRERPF